jgi:DNA-binding SARP family transcriptional activator
MSHGSVLALDRIVDELWGHTPPPTARHMVAVYVSSLRKTLGDNVLVTRRPGYMLQVDSEQIDACRFERLLAEGREARAAGSNAEATACLTEALTLWRGMALADFAYEPFAQVEIARLEELRFLAEEERIDAELALGRAAMVVAELEALVASAPLRERRRAQLMLALYRSGRQADALAEYQRARRAFVDELGIEPGPDLRELEHRILGHDQELLALEAPPAVSRPSAPESRRIVTVVVADLLSPGGDSTDPEIARILTERGLEAIRETVSRYGGTTDLLPDGRALLTFGIPRSHEDDSVRAVRAAVDLRGLAVVAGAGVATGETFTTPTALVSGEVVRTASRLNQLAGLDDIAIDETTRQLIGSVARLQPLPASEFSAHRVLAIAPDSPSVRMNFDTPLIGRQRELLRLSGLFKSTVESGKPRLVTIVGEPGVGKSRLAGELGRTLAESAQVLRGRCPAYGEGMTYWPFREIVREAAGRDGRDAILALLGDEDAADVIADQLASVLEGSRNVYPVEEVRWAAQQLLRSLSQRQPLLVVIDDLHWAEPTLIDLIENVAATADEAPILLACLARPEFLDDHPQWAADTIVIEPLTPDESAELLRLLAPKLSVTHANNHEILTTASGNPLFLEQLAAFTAERDSVMSAGGAPPTLRSLLSARLDLLGPGERAVIDHAAVVGREFWAGPVRDLLPPEGQGRLEDHLGNLVRKGLIEVEQSAAALEQAFRFRHVLIQDTAYRSLPKGRRAELHERVASWLEQRALDLGATSDELIGHHLEQAHGYLAELGIDDEGARVLATRGAARLRAAGEQALGRYDLSAAVSLLTRARALYEATGQPCLDLLVDLGTALFPLGKGAEALEILEDVIQAAGASGERGLELRATLEQSYVLGELQPETRSIAEDLRAAEGAVAELEELKDGRALARAWRSVTWTRFWLGRCKSSLEASDRALEYARRTGDRQEEAWVVRARCAALAGGPIPAGEAVRACTELLASARSQTLIACAQENLAVLHAIQGELDEARRLVDNARAIHEELGLSFRVAVTLGFYSQDVHALTGNVEAAEQDLRAAIDLLASIEDKSSRSTVLAYLASTLCDLGRYAEAEEQTELGQEYAAVDDWLSLALLSSARARLLGHRGQLALALSAADSALAIAEATDDLSTRGQVWMAKAEVHRLAEDHERTTSCLRHAIELFDRKGNAVMAARARALLTTANRP